MPPSLHVRVNGDILEIVTSALTFRNEKGELVGVEELIAKHFKTQNVRLLTLDEVTWFSSNQAEPFNDAVLVA
jgi:hypothetical protein